MQICLLNGAGETEEEMAIYGVTFIDCNGQFVCSALAFLGRRSGAYC